MVQYCRLVGNSYPVMELMSKYTNQLGIGVFEAGLGALIYQISRNTNLFIIKME